MNYMSSNLQVIALPKQCRFIPAKIVIKFFFRENKTKSENSVFPTLYENLGYFGWVTFGPSTCNFSSVKHMGKLVLTH